MSSPKSSLLPQAIVLHQALQLAEAEQLYRQVLAVEPGNTDALHLLGRVAYELGRYEEAIRFNEEVLRWSPDQAAAHNLLGVALRRAGHADEAIPHLLRAVELDPQFSEAHHNLGILYYSRGSLGDAVSCFNRALALKPDFPAAWSDLGNALADLGRTHEAIAAYARALQGNPRYAEAFNNLGEVIHKTGDVRQAIVNYQMALSVAPRLAEAHNNLGFALQSMGNLHEADAAFRRALEIDPTLATAHLNAATLRLLLGDYQNGWPEYEWRWKTGQLPTRSHARPQWQGEPLGEKTLFVHAEQGFGDTFQFVRYAPLLKQRGAKIVFQCQAALLPLLSAAPGVDRLIVADEPLPEFDFHIPLLSVPSVLKTTLRTIPGGVPYLVAEAGLVEVWRQRLREVAGREQDTGVKRQESGSEMLITAPNSLPLHIGINWRGRSGIGDFRKRDIPLLLFVELGVIPGVRLISLQRGEGREELLNHLSLTRRVTEGDSGAADSTPSGVPLGRATQAPSGATQALGGATQIASEMVGRAHPTIIDLGNDVDTTSGAFMDTAAIIMNLDLVITSDTAVAHLAGALGVPVWVALPFIPDWRWLLERSDSPWYPTMRLFRQKTAGDWAGVFQEIEAALRERVAETAKHPTP